MYKLNIECDKDCSLELQSNSEIIEVKNRGAKIIKPKKIETIKISKDVQEILDILDDFHISVKEIPVKEMPAIPIIKSSVNVKKDGCLNIKGYHLNNNSCYIDSSLFSLFAFPSDFIKVYILQATKKDLLERMENDLIYKRLTNIEKEDIITYILSIQELIKDVVEKLHNGSNSVKHSLTIRNALLKEPIDIINNPNNKPWEVKKGQVAREQDTDEFLRNLLNTFLINSIQLEISTKNYSKGKFINENKEIIDSTPIIVIDDSNEVSLETEYIEQLKEGEERFNSSSVNSYKDIERGILLNYILEYLIIFNRRVHLRNNFNDIYDELEKELIDNYKMIYDNILGKFRDMVKNKDFTEILKYENPKNPHYKQIELLINKFTKKLPAKDLQLLSKLMNDYKSNKSGSYYQYREEFLENLKQYFDMVKITKKVNIDNKSENHYIIVSVRRFDETLTKKNKKEIQFNEEIKTINGNVKLTLNSIIVHLGETIHGGHYIVFFKCNDYWYLYNNSGATIEKIGSFDSLLAYDKGYVKKNCTQLFYNNINAKI